MNNLSDRVACVLFWPWNAMEGKGRLIGWPLFVIGAIWAVLLILPLILPALVLDMVRDIDKRASGDRAETLRNSR